MGEVWVRVAVLVVVVIAATVGGLVWRARDGRVRPVPGAPASDDRLMPDRQTPSRSESPQTGVGAPDHAPIWDALGVQPGEASVTLVQFSSAFCAPCRATRQVLGGLAEGLPEVRHVEVDAEFHLDAVRALDVRSTPTTLLVDPAGRIAARAVGAPRKADVLAALRPFLAGSE
jgi:thiol-disulfide isomerase/thioredoxin